MKELDKRIAELRGDDYECIDPCECLMAMAPMEENCVDCRYLQPKPYTTDIRYAFELWEEMKKVFTHMYLEVHGNMVYCLTSRGVGIAREARTETEVICLCYIAWRENDK